MMIPLLDPEVAEAGRVRVALIALALAALLVLATGVRAIRLDPPPPPPTTTAPQNTSRTASAMVVQIDPEAVVQNDIFAPDRTAPAERYLMPGEEREDVAAPAGPPPARPVVLGTATSVDGSAFATAQMPGAQPRIIRVGDVLGIYTVVAIARGTVTFRAADEPPFDINAFRP